MKAHTVRQSQNPLQGQGSLFMLLGQWYQIPHRRPRSPGLLAVAHLKCAGEDRALTFGTACSDLRFPEGTVLVVEAFLTDGPYPPENMSRRPLSAMDGAQQGWGCVLAP